MTGLKIICIDDEELVLNLTVSLCRELPMKPEAIGFERPGEALLWLKDHTADIAIMDINMPEMNGLTLAERVKKLRPEISIIFLTGYPEYALKAFELHASGYIIKPVGRERLLSEIQYVISHNRKSEPHAHIEAHTFGEFDLMVDGVSVHFSRARAKELTEKASAEPRSLRCCMRTGSMTTLCRSSLTSLSAVCVKHSVNTA